MNRLFDLYLHKENESMQGNEIVPLFFWGKCRKESLMNTEAVKVITEFVNGTLEGTDVFLVEAKVLPGNNIRVFLDADSGVTIDRCTKINRALYKHLEESGLFPNNDFAIEVSSPGIDEPLKLHRQYKKNIGRNVEVTLMDESKKTGKLIAVGDEDITVEEQEGKGKNKIIKANTLLFNQIKHTKVLVTF